MNQNEPRKNLRQYSLIYAALGCQKKPPWIKRLTDHSHHYNKFY